MGDEMDTCGRRGGRGTVETHVSNVRCAAGGSEEAPHHLGYHVRVLHAVLQQDAIDQTTREVALGCLRSMGVQRPRDGYEAHPSTDYRFRCLGAPPLLKKPVVDERRCFSAT